MAPGGRLAVIDGADNTLLMMVDVGAGAFGVAADPVLNRVYVSCRDARLIRVVDGAIAMTPIRKVYPPDTTAAIFWLKNRKPEEWRDKQAVEHSGPNGGPIETRSLSDEALKARIADLSAKFQAKG